MVKNLPNADSALRARLHDAATEDPEFWSFRGNAVRRHSHALFQYPAMMVPQMQARLISDVRTVVPDVRSVFDPFVGSGTVLTEAMLHGLDFFGQDINPLAVLVSRVKAGPFFVSALRERSSRLREQIESESGTHIEVDFPAWQKWFRKDIANQLSRIARAIRSDPDLWSRRFFWLAMAETVRLTSNSRTSTFKLHIRPADEIRSRPADAIACFLTAVERNLSNLKEKKRLLQEVGAIRQGRYVGNAHIAWGDSMTDVPAAPDKQFDLLIASPPYGDNVSTVTYGQYSFLPLKWLDLDDIEPGVDLGLLANTHAIDTRSLGGLRSHALEAVPELCERSPAFARTVAGLSDLPRDRAVRVAAFFRDLAKCLAPILEHLRQNAYMIWVVGNRRVGNRQVPLHNVLIELLEDHGATLVTTLERRIPSKRMAVRNGIANTMRSEKIIVMRKDGPQ